MIENITKATQWAPGMIVQTPICLSIEPFDDEVVNKRPQARGPALSTPPLSTPPFLIGMYFVELSFRACAKCLVITLVYRPHELCISHRLEGCERLFRHCDYPYDRFR